MHARTRALGGIFLFVGCLSATSAAPLWAASPTFPKVEVSTPATPRVAAISKEFLETVQREVRGLRIPATYVLSAALTRYETRMEGDAVTTTCGVSVTLRDDRGGNLKAILSGRATTQDNKKRQQEGRRIALEAAVRSALRRLPAALE